MGQQEVMEFLEKQKEPLSRGEIAFFMKDNPIKISAILNKLLANEDVKAIEINSEDAMKRLGCKRRMNLYYCGKVCKKISLERKIC